MDDSEVSQMLMFAHPSQARGGASDEQQSSGSLIHYSVRVDEVVQIRDIGNGSRDLIKRRWEREKESERAGMTMIKQSELS